MWRGPEGPFWENRELRFIQQPEEPAALVGSCASQLISKDALAEAPDAHLYSSGRRHLPPAPGLEVYLLRLLELGLLGGFALRRQAVR